MRVSCTIRFDHKGFVDVDMHCFPRWPRNVSTHDAAVIKQVCPRPHPTVLDRPACCLSLGCKVYLGHGRRKMPPNVLSLSRSDQAGGYTSQGISDARSHSNPRSQSQPSTALCPPTCRRTSPQVCICSTSLQPIYCIHRSSCHSSLADAKDDRHPSFLHPSCHDGEALMDVAQHNYQLWRPDAIFRCPIAPCRLPT